MERRIVHLQVVAFPVAVARAQDPSLRGRPVAVSPGRSGRAPVTVVSAEARREGVRPGMSLERARAFCRDLRVIPPDPERQRRALAALQQAAGRYSPLVEPAGGGRLFVDLTGTARLFGAARDVAARLQREASALRLPASLGLAINKLVSGVAARVADRDGLADVAPGREATFLSPLPVALLPAVRPHLEGRLLSELNLRRILEVAALPLSRLLLAFRQSGYPLYRQARGLDDAPVRPPSRQPAVHVDETLAEDANDDRLLAAVLFLLAQRGAARLRAAGLEAAAGRLSVRHADGRGATRRLRLAPPTADDLPLFRRLQPSLAALTARRTRVRWLGLTLEGLQPAARQLPLFPAAGDVREPALAAALDGIRSRYGESAVRRLAPASGPEAAP